MYQVGDVVTRCDFDNAASPDGLTTGCPLIEFSEFGHISFQIGSTSDSDDTGPSADHTGNGGKCYNEIGSRSKTKYLMNVTQP